MSRLLKVYWDSCAWIGFINGEESKKDLLEIVYNNARSGQAELWTSTLAFVEVFRLKDEEHAPKPLDPKNLDIIEETFHQEFVKLIPVDMEIAMNARYLRREHQGLSKLGDAIHLASALRWSVDCLMTYDGNDLLHLNGKIMDHSGNLLQICPPQDFFSGPLFSQDQNHSSSTTVRSHL